MIYFDNAATTYPKPEKVYKELNEANRNAFNAGRGSYEKAREATKEIDDLRKKFLTLNKTNNASIIFTNSATESLNNIIFGIDIKEGGYIYVTPFEHNSIIRPLEELKRRKNIKVIELPFNKETWEPNLEKINDMFSLQKPSAVFISQISNVTGYIVPYEKIFSLAKKYNSINILDAAQGFGIIPINNCDIISYIVFAGHKSLYASFGIAGFIKLSSDYLAPNIFGGTGSETLNPNMPSEFPYEAGSQNIVAIRGLSKSIDWLNENPVYEKKAKLTKYLIKELKQLENIKLFLPDNNDNIFGIVSFIVLGYSSSDVGMILDTEYNICVRTGYHCAPLVHDFIDSLQYNGTIRVSLGYFNTKEEIDELINALRTL